MPCNGHPSAECFGKCSNWYIENGVHGCKASTPTSFRAQATTSIGDPQQRLQEQFNEIFKVVNKYRRIQAENRKLGIAELKSRLNLLIAQTRKLVLQEQRDALIEAAIRTRRAELSLVHPWGWAQALGMHISDYSLEKAAELQQRVYRAERRPTYLDNPMRLAAVRELIPW
jgi:septum formation topological specificity factor MinE